MSDTDTNKFDVNSDLLDLDNSVDVSVPSQAPPEAFPFIESSKPIESEHVPETSPSPRPPTPKFREKEGPVKEEMNGPVSKSEGRVVDMRGSNKTSPIETSDKLTQYGDQEEDKFIKGVKSVHGSGES